MPKAPPSIAPTSTLAMVRETERRGIDIVDVLQAAGLTEKALEDPDARIPGPTALAIWNALRERTGDPALQLVAPTALPFGAYRVIDYLVAASATVGDGVRRFKGFFGLIAAGVAMEIEQDHQGYWLCLRAVDGAPFPPVYVDYLFAALVGRIRMRIRPDLELGRVELRQPKPAWSHRYREVFRAPVNFGTHEDRILFTPEEWAAPTDTADAALARLMEQHAEILAERMAPALSGFRAQVQNAIAATSPDGGSVESVARALHISVRTLQRKLATTGTTFSELSERVRGRLAEGYLADPQVSISEVALLLGYSDQSSFNRAFRRWTGEAPGRWRQHRTG